MTLEQLKTILEGVQGFSGKVAYYSFAVGSAPSLPFITYIQTNSNNFSADGIVYSEALKVQIELYTEKRDITTERLVESALTNNGIYYTKNITYIESEKCYMIIYESEI